MTEITPEIIREVLADKHYWKRLAASIIAEAAQNVPRGTDSAIAPPSASLGRILESRLRQSSTRVRLSPPGPGPATVPMIAEIATLDPSTGRPLTEKQALRMKRSWNQGREVGKQHLEGAMRDHPGVACQDKHPGLSHNDWMDSEEEEESLDVNPLFRDQTDTYPRQQRQR